MSGRSRRSRLEVKGWGCGTQSYSGHIFLDTGLKLLDELGGTTGDNYHHTCRQGIESAGMTHLELLAVEAMQQHTPDTFDNIKRSPTQRLVNI